MNGEGQATANILVMDSFKQFSFEQVRIAQEFLKLNSLQNKNSVLSGSCPVGLDKNSKQCTSMMAMPPFSACKAYADSSWRETIKQAKGSGLSALDIAKNTIKNVPFKGIEEAYNAV